MTHPAHPSPTLAHRLGAAAVLATATALAGCAASETPGYDARFGDAARALAAQQTLDANAPARNAERMEPTDGRTARQSMDRHVDSYRTPAAPSVGGTITGSGSSSGGGAR